MLAQQLLESLTLLGVEDLQNAVLTVGKNRVIVLVEIVEDSFHLRGLLRREAQFPFEIVERDNCFEPRITPHDSLFVEPLVRPQVDGHRSRHGSAQKHQCEDRETRRPGALPGALGRLHSGAGTKAHRKSG